MLQTVNLTESLYSPFGMMCLDRNQRKRGVKEVWSSEHSLFRVDL
jgi:hypothetical protein